MFYPGYSLASACKPLEEFATLDTFQTDRRLNRVTLLAFHDQLSPAVLTVITKKGWFTTSGTVNQQRESAVTAPHPVRLNWRVTLRAPSL